jgi:protein ImuB
LRLSSKPVPVTAMSVVPDGPPISFQLRGQRHTILESVGPERIETGWWRGPHVQRDYYRASLQDGRKAWLFRERRSGRWFLHGWFD